MEFSSQNTKFYKHTVFYLQTSNLIASDSTPFRFGVNADGKYGYIVKDSEGADSVVPFSKELKYYTYNGFSGSNVSYTFAINEKPSMVCIGIIYGSGTIMIIKKNDGTNDYLYTRINGSNGGAEFINRTATKFTISDTQIIYEDTSVATGGSNGAFVVAE